MASRAPAGLNGDVPENLPVVISRPRSGAMVAGVCAGLARNWRVDPNLLRIAVVVLAFFGGLGLAAYGAGLLLMPREGQAEMPVRRFLPFTRSWSTPAVVAATIAAAVVLVGVSSSGGIGLGPVLVIFAVWFFGFRNHGRARNTPALEPTPFERAADAWRVRLAEQDTPGYEGVPLATPVEQRWTQPYTDPVADVTVRDNEPPAVIATRRRNRRLWTLALCLVGVGVLVVTVLGRFGLPVGDLAYAAAVLAALGLTLLVAARSGRPRLLLPATVIAALVTAALMGATAVQPIGEIGDVNRAFATSEELPAGLNVSAGDLTVDLSRLELAGDRDLDLKVGAGSLDLVLPKDVAAELTWNVGAGEFDAPGMESHDGFDLAGSTSFAAAAGAPTLHIRLDVGLGDITVRR